jgi:hypothetical protein
LPRISNKATTQTDLIAQHSVQDGGLRLRLNPPYGLAVAGVEKLGLPGFGPTYPQK